MTFNYIFIKILKNIYFTIFQDYLQILAKNTKKLLSMGSLFNYEIDIERICTYQKGFLPLCYIAISYFWLSF